MESDAVEITLDEYNVIEEELNCHTKAMLRMMGLKEDGGGTRLRQACTAKGINFAKLYSLRKDHKPIPEGQEAIGPKSRPVCGCEDCATKRLSYLLCKVLKPLVPESDTHCNSTQNLLADIDEISDDEDYNMTEELVIGSLDIEALYPSLDIDVCAFLANKRLYESGIEFGDLQWEEMMLYLRFMLTDEQLQDKGLFEHTPTRRTQRGRPPQFNASGSEPDTNTRRHPWKFEGCTRPDDDKKRKMWCVAVETLVVKTMRNHCFMFKGRIYRQEEGGSIGLDLTGVISEIYMSWLDSELKLLLRGARIITIF